jgi:hypothetical protein
MWEPVVFAAKLNGRSHTSDFYYNHTAIIYQSVRSLIYPINYIEVSVMQSSEAEAYKAAAKEELVDIVDENNECIGPRRRAEMREYKLRHRATYAFVRDSTGYFYVQKRSLIKDYCPGFWDPTPGGVVAAGESYEETNRREVEEEMGIPASSPMDHLFTWLYEDDLCKCYGDCWEIIYDGPIKL